VAEFARGAGDVFAALITDRYFGLPVLAAGSARGTALKIPFVFNNLAGVRREPPVRNSTRAAERSAQRLTRRLAGRA
jgi:hypothetical protein